MGSSRCEDSSPNGNTHDVMIEDILAEKPFRRADEVWDRDQAHYGPGLGLCI